MPYITTLGADEVEGAPIALEMLTRVDQRTKALIEGQARQERRWKWQTVVGVAGAIFAAVRLGVIAIPHVRARRAQRMGDLAAAIPTENPRRRRR